jgi:hypothetical protein
MFQLVPGISQHVKAGSVRAIAVLGPHATGVAQRTHKRQAGMPASVFAGSRDGTRRHAEMMWRS